MPANFTEPQSSQIFFPSVSVIVPIYNGEADLPELWRCLQAQTYPIDQVEYLLVDNGSHDRTFEILQSYQREAALPGFRPLRETTIQSSYAARNAGIQIARGEVLVFTDADCRPQADWLQRLVQPFAQPTIGLVAGEILALPGNTLLEHYADRQETLSQKHTLAHPFSPYGQTANLAIRRSVLEQVGLFRPHLTTGGDADLCWRVLQQGNWQIQFAEQAIVRHRHRSKLVELRRQWRRYGRSNRYLHELHGVDLMKDMTLRDYVYRCSRWLLKEIPMALLKRGDHQSGSSSIVNAVIDTPLDLLCRYARSQGQRQARLPDLAREIAWLPQTRPQPAGESLPGSTLKH